MMLEAALVTGTWALVIVTLVLGWRQVRILRAETKVRSHLTFVERFDGERMLKARRELAKAILDDTTPRELPETVMDFFDDLGGFLKHGYLDDEMVWMTFSYFAVRWWAASAPHNLEERRRLNDDSFFEDFEWLAKSMARRERRSVPDAHAEEVRVFLEDEAAE